MVSKRYLFVLFSLFLFVAQAKDEMPTSIDDALKLFDQVIESKDLYIEKRCIHIDSIKAQAIISEELSAYEKIGDEYRGVNIDSAIVYYSFGYDEARLQNDSVMMQRFRLLRASIMPVVGVVKESVEEYDAISPEYLYPENKCLYYESGNSLSFYISSFYPYSELKNKYLYKGMACNDSLLQLLPKESPQYKLYKAQIEYVNGASVEAIALLDELMDEISIDNNLFARATSMRAAIMADLGNRDGYLFYLALSAISDIMTGTREGTSLQMLGVALFERGDIDRAYLALTTALDNAVSSGARIRALESSQAVPVISQTFRAKDLRKMRWLWVLVVCLVFTLIVIVFVIIYLHKEKQKLEVLKMRLTKSNYAKETYMSQFLNLCSVYMDKLEDFNRYAGRKISTGQVEELHSMIKSGKALEEQNKLFYEMFDDAFLHIYPTFISDVNVLLMPDKQITISDKSKLNMELRILAFMRMGIYDNVRIARFLGLSLNTIYAYRNKMRNRAINRETFEISVLNIGRVV